MWCFLSSRGEQCDRGDPVIIKSHAVACVHNYLDPGVKPQDDNGVCGGRGNIFLNSLTTPPLRGTPPTEGNLAQCFIFYLCIFPSCHSGDFFFVTPVLDTRVQVIQKYRTLDRVRT